MCVYVGMCVCILKYGINIFCSWINFEGLFLLSRYETKKSISWILEAAYTTKVYYFCSKSDGNHSTKPISIIFTLMKISLGFNSVSKVFFVIFWDPKFMCLWIMKYIFLILMFSQNNCFYRILMVNVKIHKVMHACLGLFPLLLRNILVQQPSYLKSKKSC